MLIAGTVFLLYLASMSSWECEHHPVALKSDFCQKIALMRMESEVQFRKLHIRRMK